MVTLTSTLGYLFLYYRNCLAQYRTTAWTQVRCRPCCQRSQRRRLITWWEAWCLYFQLLRAIVNLARKKIRFETFYPVFMTKEKQITHHLEARLKDWKLDVWRQLPCEIIPMLTYSTYSATKVEKFLLLVGTLTSRFFLVKDVAHVELKDGSSFMRSK